MDDCGHDRQTGISLDRKKPCPHGGHVLLTTSFCEPAGHGSHASLWERYVLAVHMHRLARPAPIPVVILPPVHWTQVAMDLAPSISENVFKGHGSQTARAKSKKLPAGH